MKKYILFALCAFGMNAKSQPILTAGNTNPVIGDAFHWIITNNQTSPGSSGANQTWNFSSLVTSNLSQDTVVTSSSAIHGSDFPTSDVSFFIGNSYYTFFQTEIDSLVFIGAGSYSWEKINSNPEIYLTFPFTYNSTYIDSYAATENNGGTIISIDGSVNVMGDGYGTLQLPCGSFSNVLRIKMIENEVQTVSGNPTNVTRTKYLWYLPGVHQPVLVLFYNSAYGNYSTKYLSETTVDVDEFGNLNEIIIFPNPFSTQTIIQSDKILENATLIIYNSTGQQVKQIKNISGQTISLQRNNLPGGLYFIQLIQDNKTITKESYSKIIIDQQ